MSEKKINLYVVRDKVADNVVCAFTAQNDGLAIRQNLPPLSRVFPVQDLELNHVGVLDELTLEIENVPNRVISWDEYKFPVSPMKNPESSNS